MKLIPNVCLLPPTYRGDRHNHSDSNDPCLAENDIRCPDDKNCESCKKVFKAIHQARSSKLRVINSDIDGKGVALKKEPVPKGTILIHFKGKVVKAPTNASIVINRQHVHPTNLTKWVNHSCDPNCEFYRWTDEADKEHVSVKALRDISVGEEITANYSTAAYNSDNDGWSPDPDVCNCGEIGCLKTMKIEEVKWLFKKWGGSTRAASAYHNSVRRLSRDYTFHFIENRSDGRRILVSPVRFCEMGNTVYFRLSPSSGWQKLFSISSDGKGVPHFSTAPAERSNSNKRRKK